MLELYLMGIPISVSQEPKSMIEHFDFIWVILIFTIGIIVFFAIRAMNKFGDNQTELFNRMRVTEKELSYLRGEHETTCKKIVPALSELVLALERSNNKKGGIYDA